MLLAIVLLGSMAAYAANRPTSVPGETSRAASRQERKAAHRAFSQGLKLRADGKNQEAYRLFQEAARLDPANTEYLTTREVTRQQLVFDHLQQGNQELLAGKQTQALAAFRGALNLDPSNQFAQQRLRDVLSEWAPQAATQQARVLAQAGTIQLQPQTGR